MEIKWKSWKFNQLLHCTGWNWFPILCPEVYDLTESMITRDWGYHRPKIYSFGAKCMMLSGGFLAFLRIKSILLLGWWISNEFEGNEIHKIRKLAGMKITKIRAIIDRMSATATRNSKEAFWPLGRSTLPYKEISFIAQKLWVRRTLFWRKQPPWQNGLTPENITTTALRRISTKKELTK